MHASDAADHASDAAIYATRNDINHGLDDARSPALADKKLYSASAMAAAQIEGKQHYDELERQGHVRYSKEDKNTRTIGRRRADEGGQKMLHLIRHGQGFHNLLGDASGLRQDRR